MDTLLRSILDVVSNEALVAEIIKRLSNKEEDRLDDEIEKNREQHSQGEIICADYVTDKPNQKKRAYRRLTSKERKQVAKALADGAKVGQVAKRFGISWQAAKRYQ